MRPPPTTQPCRNWWCGWLAVLIGFVLSTASNAAPGIVGTPAVANPTFGGVANLMMYT
jgi:hypothetical protein